MNGMAEMRYIQAVNQALADAMRADEHVVVFGEDVAAAGGSFKATRGLLEAFGPCSTRRSRSRRSPRPRWARR